MKKFIISLSALAALISGAAYANNVDISNSNQSVGPLKITYVTAQKNNNEPGQYSDPQVVLLKAGQTQNINTPQNGFQYSGIVITQINFTTSTGKEMSQSFDEKTFGQAYSCSYSTSNENQSGQINLELSEHRLTCQHANV